MLASDCGRDAPYVHTDPSERLSIATSTSSVRGRATLLTRSSSWRHLDAWRDPPDEDTEGADDVVVDAGGAGLVDVGVAPCPDFRPTITNVATANRTTTASWTTERVRRWVRRWCWGISRVYVPNEDSWACVTVPAEPTDRTARTSWPKAAVVRFRPTSNRNVPHTPPRSGSTG